MRVRPFRVALAAVSLLAGLMSAGASFPAARQTYIVVLDGDAQNVPAVAADLARAHGGQVGFIYQHAIKGFSISVGPQGAAAIARSPQVAYVETDQVVSITAQTIPTGIERIFTDQNPNVSIDGTNDAIAVDVAVIDTGIDLDHPDLNVVASTNCSGGSPFRQSCGSGGDDDNGHGTHVAGTIGALDNGIGVVGVAPGARLWSVKVLRSDGSGYLSWIIGGIDYVTANAGSIEVANMSLGGSFSNQAFDTAIANSVAAGVAYAVAAGNDDGNASGFSPANHPDVLTVSALADFDGEPGALGSPTCRTDQDDTLADFSNWGSLVEIAAPGVCILSTWLSGGYNTISGTSMASPHAAGALALFAASDNPSSKADVVDLYDALIGTGNLCWTDDSGDGIQEPLLDLRDSSVSRVCDGGGGDPNMPPLAVDDAATTDEDTAVTIDVQADIGAGADSDPDGDTLTVTSVSNPPNGSASTDGAMVTYTPDQDFNGIDSFTYTISDGNGGTDTASVTVTVNPVNDPPVANGDTDTTNMDTAVTKSVLANDTDVDGDTLTVTSVTQPAYGLAVINSGTTVTYTPEPGFIGTDTFDYAISDGNETDTATVTITVSDPAAVEESLEGSAINNGSTWTAVVTDVNGASTALDGDWNYPGTASCDGVDTCTLSGIPKRQGSVTFTSSTDNSVVINKP
ncbi:MAG: S8 family serine peptidase [Acidimicrobiia bacterium]